MSDTTKDDGSLSITAEQIATGDTIITTQHNFPFTVTERQDRRGFVWVRGQYLNRSEPADWHRMSPTDSNVRRFPTT